MSNNKQIPLITTLAVTLLTAFLLTSCGGGAGGGTVAGGGVGGTGISSTGTITGFGSIWVNGVEFDTDTSTSTRDGQSGVYNEVDYSVGEVVTVVGTLNSDGVSGVADEVIFNDLLEGEITEAPNGGELKVLGQRVITDGNTTFNDFNQLTDLQAGDVVEVSGYRNADGDIQATSIKLKASGDEEIELKGTVENLNTVAMTFTIGSLTIDYSAADLSEIGGTAPSNGDFVEVKSDQALSGGIFIASKIELEGDSVEISSGEEVEVEGLITGFVNSGTIFYVNGQPVQVNNQTSYESETGSVSEADLANNVLVEAEGTINAVGTLVAEIIEFKD